MFSDIFILGSHHCFINNIDIDKKFPVYIFENEISQLLYVLILCFLDIKLKMCYPNNASHNKALKLTKCLFGDFGVIWEKYIT